MGVRWKGQLSPKAKFIYREASSLKKKLIRISRCLFFKDRINTAENIAEDAAFTKVCENMSSAATLFTSIQMKNSKYLNRGRRFSEEEKVLALSIYKPSPKWYRYLSKLLAFLGRRTLNNLLLNDPLRPGMNNLLFNNLKVTVGCKTQILCSSL